jgi:hypothetical protein
LFYANTPYPIITRFPAFNKVGNFFLLILSKVKNSYYFCVVKAERLAQFKKENTYNLINLLFCASPASGKMVGTQRAF